MGITFPLETEFAYTRITHMILNLQTFLSFTCVLVYFLSLATQSYNKIKYRLVEIYSFPYPRHLLVQNIVVTTFSLTRDSAPEHLVTYPK